MDGVLAFTPDHGVSHLSLAFSTTEGFDLVHGVSVDACRASVAIEQPFGDEDARSVSLFLLTSFSIGSAHVLLEAEAGDTDVRLERPTMPEA